MRTKMMIAAIIAMIASTTRAETVKVAVASNFAGAVRAIVTRFEADTGHHISIAPGSTGKHYAQIVNGAPFDAFLAADTTRPARLERDGVAVAGTRFTYARGRIALWKPGADSLSDGAGVLRNADFRHIAIASPKLAPYGAAARQALEGLGVWRRVVDRVVRGENIAQAYQFVASGNAELGLVALSQLTNGEDESYWIVPQSLYDPIEQQAVLLNDTPAARAFIEFLRSDDARKIIIEHGYDTP